jgi:hypothetical protein
VNYRFLEKNLKWKWTSFFCNLYFYFYKRNKLQRHNFYIIIDTIKKNALLIRLRMQL